MWGICFVIGVYCCGVVGGDLCVYVFMVCQGSNGFDKVWLFVIDFIIVNVDEMVVFLCQGEGFM